ncbi:uncharacterized protein YhjP [Arthrobacter sp. Hiyo8]|nr:uncharacterized protein YhjP [Arthrobacter sp. Hiyo8]
MLQPPRSGLTPLSDDAFKLSRWKTAETLVVLDALGDAQPSLSTAWTQLDGRNWRFELRAGVKFHDGTLLTAEQVAASLTAAANAKPKPRILDGVQLSVRTDGGNAVVVTTQTDDPLVPQRLSSPQLSILAASAYKPGGVVSPINAGTGPTSWRPRTAPARQHSTASPTTGARKRRAAASTSNTFPTARHALPPSGPERPTSWRPFP